MRVKNNIRFIHINSLDRLQLVKGNSVIQSFPEHLHRKPCIGMIEKGKAIYTNRDREYLLNQNDLYFINENEPHAIRSIDQSGFSYSVLCLSRGLGYYYGQENETIEFTEAVSTDNHASKVFHTYIEDIMNSQSDLERECCFILLLDWLSPFCSIQANDNHYSDMQLVCEYIHLNLRKKINLTELAAVAHVSKYYFIKCFKRELGLTPYEYLLQEKIKYAQVQILHMKSLAIVASELDFSDQSHFCNTFKKYTGVTPADYLKNHSDLF